MIGSGLRSSPAQRYLEKGTWQPNLGPFFLGAEPTSPKFQWLFSGCKINRPQQNPAHSVWWIWWFSYSKWVGFPHNENCWSSPGWTSLPSCQGSHVLEAFLVMLVRAHQNLSIGSDDVKATLQPVRISWCYLVERRVTPKWVKTWGLK